MLHEKYYIGLVGGANKHFLLIVRTKKEKERVMSYMTPQTVVSWNEKVTTDTLDDIWYLHIDDYLWTKTSLPPNIDDVLKGMNRIEGISLPVPLVVPFARKYQHLAIHSLQIETFDEKDVNTIGKFTFDSVKALCISGGGAVLFNQDNFPNLSNVDLTIDRKGRMLDEVNMFAKLEALGLRPARKRYDLFSKLAGLPLKFLQIADGHLDSLEGLREIGALTNVWLHNLPKITSIHELIHLKNLEELTIFYCRKILDIKYLLDIQGLKKLKFFGCGDIGVANIQKELEAMGLDELELYDSAAD